MISLKERSSIKGFWVLATKSGMKQKVYEVHPQMLNLKNEAM